MSKSGDGPTAFERRLQARLEADAQELDEATRERLRSARLRALAQLDETPRRAARWRLPAGAVAASLALLAVLVVVRDDDAPDVAPAVVADVDDLELLYADEDLELLEELEFFRWLDANGDRG